MHTHACVRLDTQHASHIIANKHAHTYTRTHSLTHTSQWVRTKPSSEQSQHVKTNSEHSGGERFDPPPTRARPNRRSKSDWLSVMSVNAAAAVQLGLPRADSAFRIALPYGRSAKPLHPSRRQGAHASAVLAPTFEPVDALAAAVMAPDEGVCRRRGL